MHTAPVARHVSGEYGDDHDVSILPVGASSTVDSFLVECAVSLDTLIIIRDLVESSVTICSRIRQVANTARLWKRLIWAFVAEMRSAAL